MASARRESAGFTLLEVLVALAVLALALMPAIRHGQINALHAQRLEEKTLAQWVADNRIAAFQLLRPPPDAGEHRGVAVMGGRKWQWRADIVETRDRDVNRLIIEVANAQRPDSVLISVMGYIGSGS